MIARDAALAEYEGARIHVQHLSAVESVEAVAAAKARGVAISADATPHHLLLTDEALLEELHTRLKMNPPLDPQYQEDLSRDRKKIPAGAASLT